MERLTLSQRVTKAWVDMVEAGAQKTYSDLQADSFTALNDMATKFAKMKSPKLKQTDLHIRSILLYLIAVKKYIQV